MERPVAIVTGAARGIGAAIVDALKPAMAVAALDIDTCDVSKSADVERAIAKTEKELGTPTVLVNNAGYGGPFHRADEVSEEEWDSIFATNVKGAFLFSRALLPGMKARGFGRIVNVASIQGLAGAARSSTYVASKHALIGYTRAIAAEWGEHGITCNAVCPGYIDTKMGAGGDGSYLARVLERSPVKRQGTPGEIAALVAHLVGPHGGYINGATLVADGGILASVGI
jgi:3-oxoacyl-[acyl-carrier protein] reductase